MARKQADKLGGDGDGTRQQRLPLHWSNEAGTPEPETEPREQAPSRQPDPAPPATEPTPAAALAAPPPAREDEVGREESVETAEPALPPGEGDPEEDEAAAPEESGEGLPEPVPAGAAAAPSPARDPGAAIEGETTAGGPRRRRAVVAARGIQGAEPDGSTAAQGRAGTKEHAATAGSTLMSARVDAGYLVEDVVARTRVSRDIVESLEWDNLAALPKPYYVRNHIEKLCALYNVDAAPIVKLFDAQAAAAGMRSGEAERFRVAGTDTESGTMVAPVPGGFGDGLGEAPRSFSVTGFLVSAAIVVFVLATVVALATLHLRNRAARNGEGQEPATEQAAPVGLEEFIVPRQLDAYELPMPE